MLGQFAYTDISVSFNFVSRIKLMTKHKVNLKKMQGPRS